MTMTPRREAEGKNNHPHSEDRAAMGIRPPYQTAAGAALDAIMSPANRESGREQAERFLIDCGLTPTPDAIGQLVEAFLPALKIMCERGYDPDGDTWRVSGWRGMLHEIRKKEQRLWYHGWRRNQPHIDSASDLINYAGFFLRIVKESAPGDDGWGDWGAPGK